MNSTTVTATATTRPVVVVLGASDPEMCIIENLARQAGLTVEYATVVRGGVRRRVAPSEAYAPDVSIGDGRRGEATHAICVECRPAVLFGSSQEGMDWAGMVDLIDHHNPGDPGYGLPPEKFFPGSSIGQFISILARLELIPADWARGGGECAPEWAPTGSLFCIKDFGPKVTPGGAEWRVTLGAWTEWDLDVATWAVVPEELVLAAAADHCLEPAYRGRCPGVNPDRLMAWRVKSRAEFQATLPANAGKTVYEVASRIMRDIEAARAILREASQKWEESSPEAPEGRLVQLEYADLRGRQVPELPEAAAREGIPFLSAVTDRVTGRNKVNMMAAPPALVGRFMSGDLLPGLKLVDVYGDPARGFAGGYLS